MKVNHSDPTSRRLLITGNAIRGASNGVRFAGDGFGVTPVCALNRIDAAVAAHSLASRPSPNCPHGKRRREPGSAAADSGAGTVLIGRGDPNGRVIGDVGDLFQRLDGDAGSTLYVKESGAATAGAAPATAEGTAEGTATKNIVDVSNR